VFMFRNPYNRVGETKAKDLTEGAKDKVAKEDKVTSMQTAMSTGRNLDARRRLSQSAQLTLPLLAEG